MCFWFYYLWSIRGRINREVMIEPRPSFLDMEEQNPGIPSQKMWAFLLPLKPYLTKQNIKYQLLFLEGTLNTSSVSRPGKSFYLNSDTRE
jgi:hypothetical protein